MVDLIGITLASLLERPMRAALEQVWPSPDEMRASISALAGNRPRCQAGQSRASEVAG
jgi:hypothetical protein